MKAIQYRIEFNPLTNPPSYMLRFVPQSVAGYDEVATRVSRKNPGLSVEIVKAALMSSMEEIGLMMGEGIQVTLEKAFTFRPGLHANLLTPNSPVPPIKELVDVNSSASRHMVELVQRDAHLVCLPAEDKIPVILAAEDTVLGLNDVLNSDGMLHLSGNDLFFDKKKPDCGCIIAGTRSGQTKQTQIGKISDTEILFAPHIPAQEELFNNEYTITLTTQYTTNGSLRTGTYRRRLRTPLTVDLAHSSESGVGILAGNADRAYVWITNRAASAIERLRIQAVLNMATDDLSLNLLDMQEGGAAGPAMNIPDSGSYILSGFAGSAVSSITIQVDYLTELKALIRSGYQGRMVDILDVLV